MAQSSTKNEIEKKKDRERNKLKRSEVMKQVKVPKTPAERKRTSREAEKRKEKQDMNIDDTKKIREKTTCSIKIKPDNSKEKKETEIICEFEQNNARMKKYRASLNDEEKAVERTKARIGMANSRENKSQEEKEIERRKAA